jgi:hypothetical protein
MGYVPPQSRDAYPLQGKWDGLRRWLGLGGWGRWSQLTAEQIADLKANSETWQAKTHVGKSTPRSA